MRRPESTAASVWSVLRHSRPMPERFARSASSPASASAAGAPTSRRSRKFASGWCAQHEQRRAAHGGPVRAPARRRRRASGTAAADGSSFGRRREAVGPLRLHVHLEVRGMPGRRVAAGGGSRPTGPRGRDPDEPGRDELRCAPGASATSRSTSPKSRAEPGSRTPISGPLNTIIGSSRTARAREEERRRQREHASLPLLVRKLFRHRALLALRRSAASGPSPCRRSPRRARPEGTGNARPPAT